MNRKQLESRAYAKPAVEAIRLEAHSELMETSFPSQHNPGQHGTGPSSAKQGWFEEEEEKTASSDENKFGSLWED